MTKQTKATQNGKQGEPTLQTFANLRWLAYHLREDLESKKTTLIYAYNGTGKTRLSMAFKEIGKRKHYGDYTDREPHIMDPTGDTLYFNAFTEDLFTWDNDLEYDRERILKMNQASRFFRGLRGRSMEADIHQYLDRYVDFDFRINTDDGAVRFVRMIDGREVDNIKISRGEEHIFIWCFFLAIAQLAIDGDDAYTWVKYIYIDDPISSLDEHNAIAVAHDLATMLKDQNRVKAVISTHHVLFFNVLSNELRSGKAQKYFMRRDANGYALHKETSDTPAFHHVAALAELQKAAHTGALYTHHFNVLRNILEKTASFHGHKKFSDCIPEGKDDPDGTLRTRTINLLSHGNYSLFEPREMGEDNKKLFSDVLKKFIERYRFDSKTLSLINQPFSSPPNNQKTP